MSREAAPKSQVVQFPLQAPDRPHRVLRLETLPHFEFLVPTDREDFAIPLLEPIQVRFYFPPSLLAQVEWDGKPMPPHVSRRHFKEALAVVGGFRAILDAHRRFHAMDVVELTLGYIVSSSLRMSNADSFYARLERQSKRFSSGQERDSYGLCQPHEEAFYLKCKEEREILRRMPRE